MSSHMIFGRQLSRDSEHRKALRRNLVQSLFEHGKVRTTKPRALEVKAMAEKLITLAKTGTLTSRRKAISILNDRRLVDEDQEFTGQTVIQKLFTDIGPKFTDRNGGYTRIIKLNDWRIGDAGSLVILQLLTEESSPQGTLRRSLGLRRKRSERKHQFAAQAIRKYRDSKSKVESPSGQTGAAETKAGDSSGETAKTDPSSPPA
jgi:large subunit ribosomal protein L17